MGGELSDKAPAMFLFVSLFSGGKKGKGEKNKRWMLSKQMPITSTKHLHTDQQWMDKRIDQGNCTVQPSGTQPENQLIHQLAEHSRMKELSISTAMSV